MSLYHAQTHELLKMLSRREAAIRAGQTVAWFMFGSPNIVTQALTSARVRLINITYDLSHND